MSLAKKGKSLNNEHKIKLSIIKLGNNNSLYGKSHDKNYLDKIKLVMLSKNNHKSKKVFVYSKDNLTKLLFEFLPILRLVNILIAVIQ
jgi:hypothetical protein